MKTKKKVSSALEAARVWAVCLLSGGMGGSMGGMGGMEDGRAAYLQAMNIEL
jgi:tetrahydromethanopterin S-methyltransferase subunit D